MSSLIIVKPFVPILVQAVDSIGATTPIAYRAVTPDPKEAIVFPPSGGFYAVDYDLGAVVSVDSFFVGYHNATSAAQVMGVQALGNFGAAPVNATPIGNYPLPPMGYGPPSHSFVRLGQAIASRYWRFLFTNPTGSPTLVVGTMQLGLAYQTTWGTEYGSGRAIEDTGAVERLFGGGFGIDDGVAAGGYQWTFGDLQTDERRLLYQLVKDRRTTRSVLAIEDADQTDGLNERLHWGLFTKLEPYERLDPSNTKWALQIQDWA